MNVWKNLSTTFHLLLKLVLLTPLAAWAIEDGVPFPVVGEQLDHRPPNEWKLAWMSGKADGGYIAEYIPQSEEIDSWRDGYLAIERLPYPPAEVLKEIESRKTRVADVALSLFVKKAKETCVGQHVEMSQRTNTFNGAYFAVGGGYCDRYGPSAPFGEGSFVAFVEGKNYLFRVQYGWRPKSSQEQVSNMPWRITSQKAVQYLEAIKASSLCGGLNEAACKIYR